MLGKGIWWFFLGFGVEILNIFWVLVDKVDKCKFYL